MSNVKIEELDSNTEAQYDSFLSRVSTSLLYHSLKYRNFLRKILDKSNDRYLLAFKNGELIAALPTFVKQGAYGAVVNSLPFYGSNGSIIALEGIHQKIKEALLITFDEMCLEVRAVTSTIIANPLNIENNLFKNYGADLFDERIGQFTPLPAVSASDDFTNQLMSSIHKKTRNSIRKAEKSNFEFAHDESESTMRRLHFLHEINMKAIGGLAKPWAVFQAIMDSFDYNRDYRIYTAIKDGIIVSALVVFFYNKVAEYFTPVTLKEYRSKQPLSGLIYWAMHDAAVKGCSWWNWGGTWGTQESVYKFKSRWGTLDFKYKYFIRVLSDITNIKESNEEEILEAYPYFYVLPFSELQK